jgi:hypothetical protein
LDAVHARDAVDDRERKLLVVRKRLEGREDEARSHASIPFASAANRECQRAAARPKREASCFAIRTVTASASARFSQPTSRAASSACIRWPRVIARWNRP